MAAGDQEGAAVSCGHHWWTLGSLHPGAGSWEQTVSGPGRQLRLRMVPWCAAEPRTWATSLEISQGGSK